MEGMKNANKSPLEPDSLGSVRRRRAAVGEHSPENGFMGDFGLHGKEDMEEVNRMLQHLGLQPALSSQESESPACDSLKEVPSGSPFEESPQHFSRSQSSSVPDFDRLSVHPTSQPMENTNEHLDYEGRDTQQSPSPRTIHLLKSSKTARQATGNKSLDYDVSGSVRRRRVGLIEKSNSRLDQDGSMEENSVHGKNDLEELDMMLQYFGLPGAASLETSSETWMEVGLQDSSWSTKTC